MHIKRLLSLIGIGVGIFALCMLWSTTNMALASIQTELSATVLELQWGMNTYGIFMCVPLVIVGKLGDGYGRKPLFLLGLVLAVISSLLAGFAHNIDLWIVAMSIFGLAGSIILPLSQALIVHQFPESRKGLAVSLWSILSSLSLAVGPLVGGSILLLWGWRWIYFINVAPIALAALLVFFLVAKETDLHKPECDWSGVGLLALFVASLVIAIVQGPVWGWSSPITIGLFLLALLTLTVFIFFERKSAHPLFRPDLFLQRSFLCSAVPNGCMIGFIWVAFFLIPLHLQQVKHYSAFETGLILLLITMPVALLSHSVSKWYTKIGAKPLLLIGFALLMISALLQATFTDVSFLSLSLACLTLGVGWALTWGPSITTALTSLSHRLAGIASGMFVTLQELGAVITLAIGGAIFRMSNYQASFWFLFAVSALAFLISLFLPKKIKTKSTNLTQDRIWHE